MNSLRIIPAKETRVEFQVSNSTFIATAGPVFSIEDAKEFIEKIRSTYHDADHNVPVYILGHPPTSIEHCSDDGEPSGTAGRPALAVLKGSGLGDVAIVITRYFGGTKLGTGGLVRAYSNAVREVLKKLPQAQKVSVVTTEITIPYNIFEQVKLLIGSSNGNITDQNFTTEISITIQLLEQNFPDFKKYLFELSRGEIAAQISSTDPNAIKPV